MHLQQLKGIQRGQNWVCERGGGGKGYHLPMEGMQKGCIHCPKNDTCKGEGLDLGAEPRRTKLC